MHKRETTLELQFSVDFQQITRQKHPTETFDSRLALKKKKKRIPSNSF